MSNFELEAVPYPQSWRDGESITDAALNRRLEPLQKLVQGVRPPMQRIPSPLAKKSVSSGTASGEATFRIIGVLGDILLCVTNTGGAIGTDNVGVALPLELRESYWINRSINGILYTRIGLHRRNAQIGAATEEQWITPSFFTGLDIQASSTVAPPVPTFPLGGDNYPCEWEYRGSRDWGAIVELT